MIEIEDECVRMAKLAWPNQEIASVRVSIHCYDAKRTLVAGYSSSSGGADVDTAALRVLAGEPDPQLADLKRENTELRERLTDMTQRYHEASGEVGVLHDRIEHAPAYDRSAEVVRLRAELAAAMKVVREVRDISANPDDGFDGVVDALEALKAFDAAKTGGRDG